MHAQEAQNLTRKVAVVGASGYSGEELIRLLTRHPTAELVCVTSRSEAGKALAEVYPKFAATRYAGLCFSNSDPATVAESGASVAILALPHGLAHEFAAPLLEAGLRVIDLSADFRLKDEAIYEEFYGHAHPAPSLLPQSVYGMPELYRDQIRDARLVASPGCYPTSVILALSPLLKRRLLDTRSIVVSSMSGVSGAGRKADISYSFVECNETARAYGLPKHRHLSEIEQELSAAAGSTVTINFTPHLIPVNRGILTTIYASPQPGVAEGDIAAAFHEAYDNEPFIRLLGGRGYADIKNVAFTNFLDLAWRSDPRTGRVILLSAEDNLVKGASGQAIQSLNLLCGWEETTGLKDK
jgi:N-acetyl-gamma-glutamyl-phosphate reductase